MGPDFMSVVTWFVDALVVVFRLIGDAGTIEVITQVEIFNLLPPLRKGLDPFDLGVDPSSSFVLQLAHPVKERTVSFYCYRQRDIRSDLMEESLPNTAIRKGCPNILAGLLETDDVPHRIKEESVLKEVRKQSQKEMGIIGLADCRPRPLPSGG